MQIKPQQLPDALQKQLAPVYLLCGDEPQQLSEAADHIRSTARQKGFTAREIFFADKQFEWRQLNLAGNTLSIFGDKTLFDVKLSGTPGTEGGKFLSSYCQKPSNDTLLMLTTGKITKENQRAAWYQVIDKVGVIIQAWPLAGQELAVWLQMKMQRHGMEADKAALKLLIERVEGNLLAAAQEIDKLFILYGATKLTAGQITEAVADNSRYDVFKFVESALQGRVDKVLKIISSLRGEGIAPAILLWALAREVRLIVMVKTAGHPQEKETILKNNAVWGERKQLLEHVAKTLNRTGLDRVLLACAKADRQIKGQQSGDSWETLLQAGLILAGSGVESLLTG